MPFLIAIGVIGTGYYLAVRYGLRSIIGRRSGD